MDIEKLMGIKEIYKEKMEKGWYTNEQYLDILSTINQALHWYNLVGTDADRDTFGEFTRRFERSLNELKELIGD
jgi:hypothetical protein